MLMRNFILLLNQLTVGYGCALNSATKIYTDR